MTPRTLSRLVLVALALAGALLPFPSSWIESWYSGGLYPGIQRIVTPLTNTVPVALLDVAAGALLVVAAVRFRRRVHKSGLRSALVGGLAGLVTLSAAAFVAFLLLWGLNYRRVALDQKVVFDPSRITRENVRRLGDNAVRFVNGTYALAHESTDDPRALERAFESAQRLLGNQQLAIAGVPKRSILQLYFRKAAIAGMTDPFFLEVIVNPDTSPVERPFVLLHEWAHLAGYAQEADASFVAWLACTQGDALARYSGWLAIYEHAAGALPRAERAALAARLNPGPQRDLDDIAARYDRSSPLVRDAARNAYDTYLRANRVPEGIANYNAVLRLILGSGTEEGAVPRLR
jgi:hypothetical protein